MSPREAPEVWGAGLVPVVAQPTRAANGCASRISPARAGDERRQG
jgi:hypothetical protein